VAKSLLRNNKSATPHQLLRGGGGSSIACSSILLSVLVDDLVLQKCIGCCSSIFVIKVSRT
jgi:hypothetical protein